MVEILSKEDLRRIQKDLRKYDASRERLLGDARKVVRLSGRAVLQIHRGALKQAQLILKEAAELLAKMETLFSKLAFNLNRNNLFDAYQEYVEAKVLYSIASGGGIPSLDELAVPPESYILGLLDLIGELRRRTLDQLKEGRAEEAQKTLQTMEGVYEDILSLEHATIIHGFRPKMDTSKRIIEVTRGDVLTEVRRISLEKALKAVFEEGFMRGGRA